jgi:GAF domain-containing protein
MKRRGKARSQPAKSRPTRISKGRKVSGRAPRVDGLRSQPELHARELNETREAQLATTELLKVVSRSAFDLQPVLDSIVASAFRLCSADFAIMFRLVNGKYRVAASNNADKAFLKFAAKHPIEPGRGSLVGRTVLEGRTVHIPDCLADPEYTLAEWQKAGKYRTDLGVPLLRDGAPIGVIALGRTKVKPFTETEIALVETFAAEAVIAIENTRILSELRNRTDALSEALEQQTATSEVLKAIAHSPDNLQPVFQTIGVRAEKLCGAEVSVIAITDGDQIRLVSINGTSARGVAAAQHAFPMNRSDETITARAIRTSAICHVPDVLNDPRYPNKEIARAIGYRAGLAIPMVRDQRVIGSIFVARREPGPFSEAQIELLRTFADQAVIAIENVRLFNETKEALDQQTATADVLKVISRSTFDLQAVLGTLVESAARLCGADTGIIRRREGETYPLAATFGLTAAQREHFSRYSTRPDRSSIYGRTILEGVTIHVPDVMADPEYNRPELQKFVAVRAGLGVPLVRDGNVVGVFTLLRKEPRPFTQKQIELIETFADQAVIAIENVRLFNETKEALEQQTATADVLDVISRSAFELQPVFETVAESAVRLCGADRAFVFRFDGELLRCTVAYNAPPELEAFIRENPIRPGRESGAGRAAFERQTIHIRDVTADPEYTFKSKDIAPLGTVLTVPILKGDDLLGVILTYRLEVNPFTQKQIALVEAFADQAAIAIENVRLFDAEQRRSAELAESLSQQTATADVLKVISRSTFDLQIVLDTLVESATRLCGADYAWLFQRVGGYLKFAASYGDEPGKHAQIKEYFQTHEVPIDRGGVTTRAALEGRVVNVPDVLADSEYKFGELQQIAGYRAGLGVPLLRKGEVVGVIFVGKNALQPFTEKQVDLVTIFADQAVIAIENTHLLNELRRRTDDLSEALEQQTVTADVLKVISRSAFDLQVVLDTLTGSAVKLCEADMAGIIRPQGGEYYWATSVNFPAAFMEHVRTRPILPARGSVAGRALLESRVVHIADVLADSEFTFNEAQKRGGYRTVLAIPLLREGSPIGVIVLTRTAVRPFTEKQIEVLTTFADQAVIAIENVRLFDEVQARTRELSEALQQQTATADVLKVISRSTYDLQAVLETLTESAARLCEADMAAIIRQKGDGYYWAATYGLTPEVSDDLKTVRLEPQRGSTVGRVLIEGKTVHISDVLEDPEYIHFAEQKRAGFRTTLGVPLLREGIPIGIALLMRKSVRPFNSNQIDLVETFADQAVIAIENVRLFDEVQARTAELADSLQQQTATAEVLKVISRSAFDLHTVLQTLVEAAAKLCEADQGTIAREQAGVFVRAASYGFSPEFVDLVKDLPVAPARGSATGRALLESRTVHIADVRADSDYTFSEAIEKGGFKTILAVPMLREGKAIGVLALTRIEMKPFTDKQIELVSTFADQAAIAIENVRLFESVQTRTRELAKSLEELRAAQDRLVQTEKLASLGQLTAGIAHEIKNPLNFVNNFSAVSAELIGELHEALQRVHFDEKTNDEIDEITQMLRGNLEKVVQHGKRADSIVKNMLLHSRQGSGEHRAVDVNAVVEESLNLAYHGARAEKQGFNITVQRSFDSSAGEVDLFPQEITRALINLISNGFYAATRRKAETNGGDYEPTLAAATKDLGDSVEITIRDNGTGIPPDVKERIFNPFFTTKPAGEGTGLGLSISHDIIVKQHCGSIDVDTALGEYTEFRITLPRKAATLAKTGASA